MSTIVLRNVKGAPLTNTEVDNNFSNLNTDKLELGGTYSSGTANSVLYLNGSKAATSSSSLAFDGTQLSAPAVDAAYGIYTNKSTVAANVSIASGDNAMSAGPMSINTGVAVTVAAGSFWTIV